MNRIQTAAAVLGLSLAAIAPAVAQDAYHPGAWGPGRAEAQHLTLNEIAAVRFNRGSDSDNRQVIVERDGALAIDPARHAQLIAAAGLTPEEAEGMSLNALAVGKFNAEARDGDRQRHPVAAEGAAANRQLVAAAGLAPGAAAGMSLTDVAAVKFWRDTWNDQK